MHRFLILTITVLLALNSANSRAADALPAMLIRIPESLGTFFVAETTSARFHRFDRQGDDIVKTGSFYMSIGQNGAGKQRSGDRRTPIGAYFVTEQLDTSRMHEKYGVTAYPLDYPNEWDRRAARNGDGIWLHGVLANSDQRPKFDTDGCIALPNEDLSSLMPVFADNVTPVLVTRQVRWVESVDTQGLREELEERVFDWAASKARGDLYSYLSLYAEDYSRWGMDRNEWSALALQADDAAGTAAVSDLLLLAYPGEDDLYFSRFRLTVVKNGQQTVTMARLYWRRDGSGAFRIVAESRG